ncbi:MAG: hypothetical protein ACRDGM_13035 [bacterium]
MNQSYSSYINVPGFSYDVAPDGRFVLLKGSDEGKVTRLNVVLSWLEELKRRATSAR